MKRNGLTISIIELQELLDSLEKETRKNCKNYNLFLNEYKELQNVKHQINIINKSGDSDGWRIE